MLTLLRSANSTSTCLEVKLRTKLRYIEVDHIRSHKLLSIDSLNWDQGVHQSGVVDIVVICRAVELKYSNRNSNLSL